MTSSTETETMLVQAYLDGELSGSDLEEFERRLGESDQFCSLVDGMRAEHEAVRGLLVAPPAPHSLRGAVADALDVVDDERARERRREFVSWLLPGAATLAAAAALTMFVTLRNHEQSDGNLDRGVARNAIQQRFREQPIELVAARRAPSRAVQGQPVALSTNGDTEGTHGVSRSLSEFFQTRVSAPDFESSSVRLRGWRPSQLLGRAAAELQYLVGTGERSRTLTVHIVSARGLELRGRRQMVLNGRLVWTDQAYGYNAVLFRDSLGVGYVFSSEMNQRELLSLVAQSDVVRFPGLLPGRR